ncbi:MAG: PD-(D/E)XK nuclease family protein, partial [Bacteroidales bacterium]
KPAKTLRVDAGSEQDFKMEKDRYAFGTFEACSRAIEPKDPATSPFRRYLSSPWHRAIRLKSNQMQRGLQLHQAEHLEKGNLLHRVMENIRTINDLPTMLRAMVVNGELDEPTSTTWEQNLSSLLKNPLLEGCFTQEYPARAEAVIADAGGQYYRPDRVVFLPQKTIIIDYKTGREYPAHAAQMQTYSRLLSEMGYPQVKSLLIYLDQNTVKSV